jgi:hypothetical protein
MYIVERYIISILCLRSGLGRQADAEEKSPQNGRQRHSDALPQQPAASVRISNRRNVQTFVNSSRAPGIDL